MKIQQKCKPVNLCRISVDHTCRFFALYFIIGCISSIIRFLHQITTVLKLSMHGFVRIGVSFKLTSLYLHSTPYRRTKKGFQRERNRSCVWAWEEGEFDLSQIRRKIYRIPSFHNLGLILLWKMVMHPASLKLQAFQLCPLLSA